MYARDILSRPVVTVQPQTPLREAVALLTEHGFAALPVVDDGEHVLGMFSEADALAAESTHTGANVAAVMSVPADVVEPGTLVGVIAARMLALHRRSMPVVEAGVLVGIVARRDLLRALICDDAAIESKVRARLDNYLGSRRQWAVAVADGHVSIRGPFADAAEQRTVSALAMTVEGVEEVRTLPDPPPPGGAVPSSERLQREADRTVG
ncbi:CBS domain-containing protein [Nocardia miyunensis]|uniref:CBS domain-containing protein n=1 Tax=Nocardia miyunensis TaxID=282684 RepID=UPI0008331C07|nr:CBS domain-containing protein [Nocardia miyunensis]